MESYCREYIGFPTLTKAELEVLLSFNEYGELVMPDVIPDGLKAIKSLENKGLVKRTRPFKLTKNGWRNAPLKRNVKDI